MSTAEDRGERSTVADAAVLSAVDAAAAVAPPNAEMRMADEIDQKPSAQGRRTDFVRGADEVNPTVEELGITRQRLSEWRDVRDAGPEIVEAARSEYPSWRDDAHLLALLQRRRDVLATVEARQGDVSRETARYSARSNNPTMLAARAALTRAQADLAALDADFAVAKREAAARSAAWIAQRTPAANARLRAAISVLLDAIDESAPLAALTAADFPDATLTGPRPRPVSLTPATRGELTHALRILQQGPVT